MLSTDRNLYQYFASVFSKDDSDNEHKQKSRMVNGIESMEIIKWYMETKQSLVCSNQGTL